MSTAGNIAKLLNVSRKYARKRKKAVDRTAKDTNKKLRKIGKKLIFMKPVKGGRRRFVRAV